MKTETIILGAVAVGGTVYLLAQSGALPGFELPPSLGGPANQIPGTSQLTPGQKAALDALRTTGAGNAPAVDAPSWIGTPSGVAAVDSAIVGGVGIAANAGLFGSAVVGGIATAGIGLAVAFFSYEWLKQRASMQTNDVRDAWQKQFIAISDALGIPKLTYASGPGGGGYSPGDDGQSNGNIEMSRVIFYFDHDATSRLWTAVTKTQNEAQFRAAAAAVDSFLASQGVPVHGVNVG